LPQETKRSYKAPADRSNGKRGGHKDAEHPTKTEEQLRADAFPLYWHRNIWAATSAWKRISGRPENILYISMEKQERTKEENMTSETENHFNSDRLDFI
jgi:hypothetical protein